MQDNKTRALNLRIDENIYNALDQFCSACGMSKKKVVEKAVDDFIEHHQDLEKEMKKRNTIGN